MIRPLTQAVLHLLRHLAYKDVLIESQQSALSQDALPIVLRQLEAHGLITLSAHQPRETLGSYTLARPLNDITLLDVLKAIGEQLDYSRDVDERLYQRHGAAAHKLGAIHLVTHKFLSEIKLVDIV